MSIYNPIKNIVFLTQEEAVAAAHSLHFGDLKNDLIGVSSVEISDTPEASRDTEEDIYFSSETDDAFYSYTIEKHEITFILKVYRTKKHGMISAAKRGDFDAFIKNFDKRIKMIEFSLSTAIIHDNWEIVEYLIDNYELKNKAIWLAIRYDRLEIVQHLLLRGVNLTSNWLAYCMYSNSFNVVKELLGIQKFHLKYSSDELKTSWFFREVRKDTPVAKYVKEILLK